MGAPAVIYTPTGDSSRTLDLPPPLSLGPDAPHRVDGSATFTEAGLDVHVSTNEYDERAFRATGLVQVGDAGEQLAQELSEFWAHASAGGVFALALDQENVFATELREAEPQGESVVRLDDNPTTGGVSIGDWVTLAHATLPYRRGTYRVTGRAGGGDNRVTIEPDLVRSYPVDSALRHDLYWPVCAVAEASRNPFKARRAGRGYMAVDLAFRFREVVEE